MHCPTLKELPSAPIGKTGWPWIGECPQLPDTMPDGRPWPKISIVTPNYNYGQFIEETIRSVLLQSYPNLEYIIIDAGSDDNSVEIIKKYEKWLAYWVTEIDKGQINAINKGFMYATGDIFCWLNSDDWLERGALKIIAEILSKGGYWVTGNSLMIDESYRVIGHYIPEVIRTSAYWVELFLKGTSVSLPQPSTFWIKDVWLNAGPLDEKYQCSFDHEFFFRVYRKFGQPIIINYNLAFFRSHKNSKTCTAFTKFMSENLQSGIKYRHILPLFKRLKTPFLIVQTQGRLRLYEFLEPAKEGRRKGAVLYLFRTLLRYPFLLFDRLFLGFIHKQISSALKFFKKRLNVN